MKLNVTIRYKKAIIEIKHTLYIQERKTRREYAGSFRYQHEIICRKT